MKTYFSHNHGIVIVIAIGKNIFWSSSRCSKCSNGRSSNYCIFHENECTKVIMIKIIII